jgi:hypothetical protein
MFPRWPGPWMKVTSAVRPQSRLEAEHPQNCVHPRGRLRRKVVRHGAGNPANAPRPRY